MARRYELVELANGAVAVCGPDYASKALFRGMGAVKFQTVAPGKSGWIVKPVYRSQADAMVARQNGESVAPVRSTTNVVPFRSRTSSGWCEACEDGATINCRRGGCY